jgi:hypothetical protein
MSFDKSASPIHVFVDVDDTLVRSVGSKQLFSMSANSMLKVRFCIAGAQGARSMRARAQKNWELMVVSRPFFQSPTSSLMTRARLIGRAQSRFTHQVAVAIRSKITKAS